MNNATDRDYPRASLIRCLGAICYDSFLVLAIALAVTALTLPLRVYLAGGETFKGSNYSDVGQALYLVLILVSVYAFFAWFWHKSGQTLGMQTWRIKLVSDTGGCPSYQQCTIRFLGAIVSLAFLGAGYWWMLIDRQGKSWHDHLSGSHLAVLAKKSAKNPD
jgi:uncharacterized RDD family membrane protein YckC